MELPSSATLLTVFAVLNGLSAPVYAADDAKKDDPPPKDDSKSDSSSSNPPPSSSSSSKSEGKPAPTSSSSAASSTDSKATTTSSSAASKSPGDNKTAGGGLTGLPTLTGIGSIPTYPPPAVPDTKDAPFMQSSSAPEGTVFIAVGAILGAFFLAILIWRAIVSLLLHRSVERASKAQHVANTKGSANFPAPPAPFYKYTDQESTRSLGPTPGRVNRRSTRGPAPSSNPSQSNLFFSPTAANAGAGGNRGSSYLPAGFYAAGSAAPAQQQGQSINMANLNPASGHYANGSRNTLSGSPPESPMFHPRRDASTSSINLAAPLAPGQRAPSAYLEDLLTDDPSSLPPPHMPASGNRR